MKYCVNQKVLITNGCYSGIVGIVKKVSEAGFYMIQPIEERLTPKYFTDKEFKPYKDE